MDVDTDVAVGGALSLKEIVEACSSSGTSEEGESDDDEVAEERKPLSSKEAREHFDHLCDCDLDTIPLFSPYKLTDTFSKVG